MKTISLFTISILIGIAACRPSDDEIKAAWNETRASKPDPFANLTAFERDHGVGPIKEAVKLEPISIALAKTGEKTFENKCYACHRIDTKLVGPALGDILSRRKPEFVLNMMLNPQGMIDRHPEARKLFAQYLIPMANQNLSQAEALAILEYLRKASSKKPS